MNANYKYMLIYALVYPIVIGVIMSVGGKNRLLSSSIFSNIILIKLSDLDLKLFQRIKVWILEKQ